ncbi:MAG TPA: hypothetical protein VGE30_01945 [Candidatus Saccharimonadales bacterium]
MSEVQVTDAEIAASHAAFSDTEHGQRLAADVRFGRYRPVHVSKEDWVLLLGADVNNLHHMSLTRGLARDFIRTTNKLEPGRISPADAALLEVSAMVHDRAESITGDITFSLKTAHDEIREQKAFRTYLPHFGDSSPGVRMLIERAVDEVIWDHESPCGQMLNAVENVGYMRTALRAGRLVAEQSTAYYVDRGLRWLGVDVLISTPPRLREYAQIFPAVGQYVDAKQDDISSMYRLLEDERNFLPYGSEFREKYTAYGTSRYAWENAPDDLEDVS